MHYLLFYEVVDGYAEKREPFREQHLKYARQAFERGELVLAGAVSTPTDATTASVGDPALAEPLDGAVLVFRGPTPQFAEAFAKADPYVINGLIKSWRVRKWMTVIPPQ